MSADSYKQRVLRMSRERGDFVSGDDGYWVWWPTGRSVGAVTAIELRVLAEELDRLNADWDKEIDAFFATHRDGAS